MRERREASGDLRVPLVSGVLVAHRGGSRALASPTHHLGESGAGLRAQGQPGVAQVVEVRVRQAGLHPGELPCVVHVVRAQFRAVRAGEQRCAWEARRQGRQVLP